MYLRAGGCKVRRRSQYHHKGKSQGWQSRVSCLEGSEMGHGTQYRKGTKVGFSFSVTLIFSIKSFWRKKPIGHLYRGVDTWRGPGSELWSWRSFTLRSRLRSKGLRTRKGQRVESGMEESWPILGPHSSCVSSTELSLSNESLSSRLQEKCVA